MNKSTGDKTAISSGAGTVLAVVGNRLIAPWLEWPIVLQPSTGGDVIGGEGGDVIGEEWSAPAISAPVIGGEQGDIIIVSEDGALIGQG